jgi:pimeloyl-ACP methyl ester carboxylesterase
MEKSFQYQNTTISYRIEGQGKPVVLLHGFGEDSQIFNQQIEFLKGYCQIIVPDLPGSGKSQLLQYPASNIQHPVFIEAYAQLIQALLRQESISTCTLLGHSMGGYITLAFAELFPEMLDGFGLVHSTAFADNEEKKQNRQRGIELMEQYGAHSFLKTTTPNLFGKQFKEKYPEKVEELIEAGKQFSKEALQQYYKAMMERPDRTHVLQGSKIPVLFIMGTEDVAAPLNDMLQQSKLPNCSYIHVLDGVGHMSMWEATSQLNQHLLAFINR